MLCMANKTEPLKIVNDTQAIAEYLKTGGNSILLTAEQKNLLERIDFCDNLIRKYKKQSEIVLVITTRFGISRQQAYKTVQATQEIYGSVATVSKEYWRKITIDWIIDAVNLARESKDIKGLNAALANLIKALGLDKTDITDIDLTKYEAHTYNIQLPKDTEKLMLDMVKKGVVNLADLFPDTITSVVTDISHLQDGK